MKTRIIVAGAVAGFLVCTLLVAAIAGFLVFRVLNAVEANQHNNAGTFIDRYIPPSAELVESHDDHGGFLGDGTLWQVYQLGPESKSKFETRIDGDVNWKALPLPEDLIKLMDTFRSDMPYTLKKGQYFFYDFQPEWNPDNKSLRKPAFDRPSFNFVIMIYDPQNGRIYVDNEDT